MPQRGVLRAGAGFGAKLGHLYAGGCVSTGAAALGGGLAVTSTGWSRFGSYIQANLGQVGLWSAGPHVLAEMAWSTPRAVWGEQRVVLVGFVRRRFGAMRVAF